MSVGVEVLVLAGCVFMLIGAIGLLRFPDPFMRMHASAKAGTLGKALVALAVALHVDDLQAQAGALLLIAFFFLTAPVAVHMVARMAYRSGVPFWERTVVEDLRGKPASPGEAASADWDEDEG